MKYELLGTVNTVMELIELLHDNAVNEDALVTNSGAKCHVIAQTNEEGEIANIIFEDNDYSDEWNEEEEI